MPTSSPAPLIAGAGINEIFERVYRGPREAMPRAIIHLRSDFLTSTHVTALYFIEPPVSTSRNRTPHLLRPIAHGFEISAYYHEHLLRHVLATEHWFLRLRSMLAGFRLYLRGGIMTRCLFCNQYHEIPRSTDGSLAQALSLFARFARWKMNYAPAARHMAVLSSVGLERLIQSAGVVVTFRGLRVTEPRGVIHHFFGMANDEELLSDAIVIMRSPDIRLHEEGICAPSRGTSPSH